MKNAQSAISVCERACSATIMPKWYGAGCHESLPDCRSLLRSWQTTIPPRWIKSTASETTWDLAFFQLVFGQKDGPSAGAGDAWPGKRWGAQLASTGTCLMSKYPVSRAFSLDRQACPAYNQVTESDLLSIVRAEALADFTAGLLHLAPICEVARLLSLRGIKSTSDPV